MNARPAPAWSVSHWFNADALTLESLRGRSAWTDDAVADGGGS